MPRAVQIEHEQEPELGRLVDDRSDQGDRQAKRVRGPQSTGARPGAGLVGVCPVTQRHSAALRIASHSRSACASRGETSG